MSRQIAVVYEGLPDFNIAVELADRVIVESIAWMTEDDVLFQRTWRSESSAGFRLSWAGIDHLAREAGVSVSGLYDEEPGEPDAHAASRAILYLRQEFPDLDAIVLIRDQDDQPLRRQGLNQARKKHGDGLPVAIGLAVPMREAWVLCGYDPDETELTRFDEARAHLKFDPRTRSHDVRDPKAVLKALTAGDLDRERRCWVGASLPTLRDRGAENGLAAYLDDVRDRLVGLFGRAA